jgi:3-hydroxyisobutyrate dehydrogenase-like beta-hydroxyacid dehydrogenase
MMETLASHLGRLRRMPCGNALGYRLDGAAAIGSHYVHRHCTLTTRSRRAGPAAPRNFLLVEGEEGVMLNIALLHPGEMGAAVGACLVSRGFRVCWVSDRRSPITRARAQSSGFEEFEHLSQCLQESDIVLSICPPGNALELAREVASIGFNGLYVDANAVAPATSRQICRIIEALGSAFIDGGIIGPPPISQDRCRLYLCGRSSEKVASLFTSTNLQAVVLDGDIGTASAIKMCYAAWTKGTTALLAAIHALAQREGIDAHLQQEWACSQPQLLKQSDAISNKMQKAWRWVAEMEEIAATFQSVGLPDGFHQAASEIYSRLAIFKGSTQVPPLTQITDALLQVGTDELNQRLVGTQRL